MADIFISYKREERPTALRLATALEAAGWTVWWDLELVGGERFDDTIQAELDKARCVVVLWSTRSVGSDFVKDEASYALGQRKLLPARIDDANVPFRFHRLHTVDLTEWGGGSDATAFQELSGHIAKRIGAPPDVAGEEPERPPASQPVVVTPGDPPPEAKEATVERLKEIIKQWDRRNLRRTFQDTIKDGTKGPEMVVIPAGSFTMGSPKEERGRHYSEGPQHRVTFAKRFAMGKYTVTFAEYDQYCASTGSQQPKDESWGRETRPVINVSWEDAVAYCKWLSAQTGKRYRLPSEAEWEYAARAGTTTAYWWGDELSTNRANCDGCGSKWDKKQTAPVGSFAANAFGLHDMLGNVREWVQDVSHNNYEGAPADGSPWEAGGEPNLRVWRGGSWTSDPRTMRSANRGKLWPNARFSFIGFRLAQDLD